MQENTFCEFENALYKWKKNMKREESECCRMQAVLSELVWNSHRIQANLKLV